MPSIQTVWKRALRSSFQNLFRNNVLTIATVSVLALLLFVGNIVMGLQHIAKEELEKLEKNIELSITLRENTDPIILQEVIGFLEQHPLVHEVRYTSKEEALENLLETLPEESGVLQEYDIKNPLPATISIVTQNPSQHQTVLQDLQKTPLGASIVPLPETEGVTQQMVNRFETLIATTKRLLVALTVIFISSSLLIIENAIHLTMFYRRRDIEVMRLAGATPNTIRLPFLMEGALLGALAWVVMLGIILVSINTTGPFLRGGTMLAIELAFTMLLGMGSSLIALERYLRKEIIV